MGNEDDSFLSSFHAHQRHDDGKIALFQSRTNLHLIDEQSGLLKM